MNERIHFPLAKMAATELFEGLFALQHDKKCSHIHRETIEEQFINLSRELGFAVYPLHQKEAAE